MQSSTMANANRNYAGNASSNAAGKIANNNYTTTTGASGCGSKALTINKRPTGGEVQPTSTSSTSCLNLDQSYRSMQAQSRRNVPSHYFHPVGEAATVADSTEASLVAIGAGGSSPLGKAVVLAKAIGGKSDEHHMPMT